MKLAPIPPITTDVLIWFLTWAITLFLLTLDGLIRSIRQERKRQRRRKQSRGARS